MACITILQSKTLNKKSRTVSPTKVPFLYSSTRTPTTNNPNIFGITFNIPVLGSIVVTEPGPSGLAALKAPLQITG